MAIYSYAKYNRVSLTKQNFYISIDGIKWNNMLLRENIYHYDEEIGDFDILKPFKNLDDDFFSIPFSIIKITAGDAHRPDIIAKKYYGDTEYYWILMYFNCLDDVEDIQEFMSFKLPDKGRLDNFFMNLHFNAKQTGEI